MMKGSITMKKINAIVLCIMLIFVTIVSALSEEETKV